MYDYMTAHDVVFLALTVAVGERRASPEALSCIVTYSFQVLWYCSARLSVSSCSELLLVVQMNNFIQKQTVAKFENLKSDLQPDTEDLFIKLTLCFKRDLYRFGLDEPMALSFEQNFLHMSSLRFHDLLYRLSLLGWHDLVLCSLQELYSCQMTPNADVYAEALHTKRGVRIFCALLTGLRSAYTLGISSTVPPISLSI